MRKIIIGTVTIAALIFSSDMAFAKSVTVKKGDTLFSISKNNQMNVEELKKINKLSSNNIYVGQILNLNATTNKTPTLTPNNPSAAPTNETDKTYIVSRGDTLYRVALNHKVSVANIKQWNNLKTDSISVGQKLKISTPNKTPVVVEKPITPAPEKPIVNEPVKDIVQPVVIVSNYKVVSGDTLYKIATKYKITVDALRSLNKLKNDTIYVGQLLTTSSTMPTEKPSEIKPVNPNVQKIMEDAVSLTGIKYLWAGITTNGFDCSGFVQYVLEKNGITVPRTSQQMWNVGAKVEQPSTGDLVFFDTSGGASHVGFYIGDNKFIGAQTSTGVAIADMNSSYWKSRYLGAKILY